MINEEKSLRGWNWSDLGYFEGSYLIYYGVIP